MLPFTAIEEPVRLVSGRSGLDTSVSKRCYTAEIILGSMEERTGHREICMTFSGCPTDKLKGDLVEFAGSLEMETPEPDDDDDGVIFHAIIGH